MNAILDYALLQYRNPYKYFFMLMMILWSAKTTELLKIAPDNMVYMLGYNDARFK
jgi:predicted phosphatase